MTGPSTRLTISDRRLPRRRSNTATPKTTIGATCLRLRRLPKLALLPVLGVALPIAIGAVAFHRGFHHDGIAPRGQPRLRQAAFAPPPLPANIKPVAPACAGRCRRPLLPPTRLSLSRSGRSGGAANPAAAGRTWKAGRSSALLGACRAGKPGRRCDPCRAGACCSGPGAQAASDPASGRHSARRGPPRPGRSPKAMLCRQRRLRSQLLQWFRAVSLCRLRASSPTRRVAAVAPLLPAPP